MAPKGKKGTNGCFYERLMFWVAMNNIGMKILIRIDKFDKSRKDLKSAKLLKEGWVRSGRLRSIYAESVSFQNQLVHIEKAHKKST